MEFEWDGRKAARNLRRHGVDFVDAVVVFDDERALTLLDEGADEDRFLTFGSDALGRVLAVCYTVRAQTIRIISARRATSRERAQYEEKRL